MKKRFNWTMEWVAFIPNVGHVLVVVKDGKLIRSGDEIKKKPKPKKKGR